MQQPAPAATIVVLRSQVRLWRGPLPLPEPPAATPSPATSPKKKRAPSLPLLPEPPRPRVRGDCLPGGFNAERPCRFCSCRHHLLLLVDEDTGTVEQMAERVEDLPHTCALDIADIADEANRETLLRSLEPYLGVTRERIRQAQLRAQEKLGLELARGGYDPEEILAYLRGGEQPKE